VAGVATGFLKRAPEFTPKNTKKALFFDPDLPAFPRKMPRFRPKMTTFSPRSARKWHNSGDDGGTGDLADNSG
jgi:hypothetical protein